MQVLFAVIGSLFSSAERLFLPSVGVALIVEHEVLQLEARLLLIAGLLLPGWYQNIFLYCTQSIILILISSYALERVAILA
jgi:hypothetical protein